MKCSLYNHRIFKKVFLLVAVSLSTGLAAFAEGPKPASSVSNPFVLLLVVIAIVLALVIALMARLVLGAAGIFVEKAKAETKNDNTTATKAAVITGLILLQAGHLLAQTGADSTAVKQTGAPLSSVSGTAYYMLAGVVFTELILIVVLLYMLRVFVNVKKKAVKVAAGAVSAAAVPAKPAVSWWYRFNKLKPLHEELNLDLGHNYDGIRELDNKLPPWWLYGFYITIIFAGAYLYMHHVSHTLPSNLEQYQAQVAEGEAQKEAYLKKSANNVDETTVKLLTDEASLTAGKTVFETMCFACHGKFGEGGVGPNLTDDYWLHGGTINDVFKTIKYGWPDKGMKSWKDDYSPVQLAQIASYVKSLHGTKPPNAKAPQGTLVTGDNSTGSGKDSTTTTTTTTTTAPAAKQ
jgi:cytochrome c oxidase cbb3-type subunit 3